MSMKRIGVFGGTFNPPHVGHVSAARSAVAALGLDKLFFVPTNIPPHKVLPEGSASPSQRLEMAQIAASMVPMAEATDIEIKRSGASYTVDTLAEIKARYNDAEIWLIIGTDMLMSFDRWRSPDEIASLCRLAVLARDYGEAEAIVKQAKHLKKLIGANVDIVNNRVVKGSSSDFRNGEGEHLIPSEIKRYIRLNNLYGGMV